MTEQNRASKVVRSTMALMGNLPEDIIRDIITALPAKTLARFRCVHKSWQTLISDPDLIRAHLTHFSSTPHRHSLLFKKTYLSDQTEYILRGPAAVSGSDLDPPARYHSFFQSQMPHIAGSCNGLLCLYSGMGHNPKRFSICICNPSIMRSRVLPQSNSHCFLFHLGFGFYPVSSNLDDYKVIKIVDVGSYQRKRVEVYSLRSNSWRWINNTLPGNLNILDLEESLMFQGCVHWRAASRPGAGNNDPVIWFILCFDMLTEAFREIVLPEIHAPTALLPVPCNVGVVEGCLCILDYWDNLSVMKEYGVAGSWSRRYAISREAIGMYLSPLGFTCSGEVILENERDGWLYCYDPKNENLEDIELPRFHKGQFSVSVVNYVESLVWVL